MDTWQRSVLFLDILRQRGNEQVERSAAAIPNVLSFQSQVLADARSFGQPANYLLVEIVPPAGIAMDPRKRPFVVVDPRAGHGPGIGGMKADSEIGVALRAGHPCYFIGFSAEPCPGQTIEDVCLAEAQFLEIVATRHPQAAGKPVVIANCQAGWQIMMTAARFPHLFGPIMLAGTPLSYWAGARGVNPMRYSGGLLGGTWLTALIGDLGKGIFDGAWLIQNFESLNPANTLWAKPYNVFANVDNEEERFLDFEKWWGNPVLLTAQEMQAIADSLFVGNRLSRGEIRASDGARIDLANVAGPIILFCSWGDDITPPQQALQWITDVHASDEAVVAAGQTIVYCLHQSIGHLGIFVSGKVATKEHREFVEAMEAIDLLGPGLWEAVIDTADADLAGADLVRGDWLMRLERRSLDDIRAICGQQPDDDRKFETVARFSEAGKAVYDMTLGPVVRATATEGAAEVMRHLHPNRLRFSAFSDRNPAMALVTPLAAAVREQRRPASPANPFIAAEHMVAGMIESNLKLFGSVVDSAKEIAFHAIWGQPWVQALAGVGAGATVPARDLVREELARIQDADALDRMALGGPAAALVRALIHVAQAADAIDERFFVALGQQLAESEVANAIGARALKALLREQQRIMRLAPDDALTAIPLLLADVAPERRRQHAGQLALLVRAGGADLAPEVATRLAAMMQLIAPDEEAAALPAPTGVPPAKSPRSRRAAGSKREPAQ